MKIPTQTPAVPYLFYLFKNHITLRFTTWKLSQRELGKGLIIIDHSTLTIPVDVGIVTAIP